MIFPKLQTLDRSYRTINSFGGYIHTDYAPENAFYDMADLSSDKYPLMSVRKCRKRWTVTGVPGYFDNGFLSLTGDKINDVARINERLVFVTDTYVYADGRKINGLTLDDISPKRHRIAAFGRNFMIYPDGIFIERQNNGFTVKHARYNLNFSDVKFTVCEASGEKAEFDGYGDNLPQSAESGTVFLKTGDRHSYLYTYDGENWDSETEVFLKAEGQQIGKIAYTGELIYIYPLTSTEVKCSIASYTSSKLMLEPLNRFGTEILESGGSIVVSSLEIRRKMPYVDFMCEHSNRMWGCRYGEDENGNFVNEIYASKLGEPTLWDEFDGISTDSYCVSLGCPGYFTGICTTGGDVIFFKENEIIRVSGSTPSDFTVTELPGRGIKKGYENSLQILNEKAFYISESGMTVYDGALPYSIQNETENEKFECICSSSRAGKYCIVLKKDNGERFVSVYDTRHGTRYIESDRENTEFSAMSGDCEFAVCKSTDAATGVNTYSFWNTMPSGETAFDIFSLTPPNNAEYGYVFEEIKNWYGITGNFYGGCDGTQKVRGIIFRVEPGKNSVFKAEISCDGDETYKEICRIARKEKGIVSVRTNTPRCDSFRLKLSGDGACTVYAVEIITEKTSGVTGIG